MTEELPNWVMLQHASALFLLVETYRTSKCHHPVRTFCSQVLDLNEASSEGSSQHSKNLQMFPKHRHKLEPEYPLPQTQLLYADADATLLGSRPEETAWEKKPVTPPWHSLPKRLSP